MTTDRELDEILAEIGREHRAVGAPERLESVLRAASVDTKASIKTPRLRSAWAWALVTILLVAVAMGGVMWQARRNQRAQNQQVQPVPAARLGAESARPSTGVAGNKDVEPMSARALRTNADQARHRKAVAKEQASNSLDEFVPLPVSEGLPPAAELSVVRIKLRGRDLQQYGLETPADGETRTMLAEFVVGEDGLPRAIRIVR
jgi:hypothetical protein